MKKEKAFSRRKKALRRVLMAAVVLFLVNHILLFGLLFPIQAIRHNEERLGTGRTAMIRRDWLLEVRWSCLSYLSENEDVTMLSGTCLTWIGWVDNFGVPVDCSEDAPMHCGWWSLSRNDVQATYIFGRVDDPSIVRVQVEAEYTGFRETDLPVRQMEMKLVSEEPDWMEKDGHRYFLIKTMAYGEEKWNYFRPTVTGYDKYYCEAARMEIDEAASTYMS